MTAPETGAVQDVEAPVAGPGQVVVDVERAGICGTDVEFWTGEMAYLHQGHAAFPMRLGHEWCGRVSTVGEGVDRAWLGRRVTGDTMLGCGQCRLCRSGRQHVCGRRHEIGIRGGWPGALAEQLAVPATHLFPLPDSVDPVAGAMVEPGGNAWRAAQAANAGAGTRVLVYGPGTIGLLVALFAAAEGSEVHVAGHSDGPMAFARTLGLERVWHVDDIPDDPFDAVVDCTFGAEVPALAVQRVQPGGRVVLIGLSGTPSTIDTRDLVLHDLSVVGILSASPGLAGVIERYADGRVDPRPLVTATVGLADAADALAGRLRGLGAGPKIHIDPRA